MATGRVETAAPYVKGNRSGVLQSTHTQRGAAGRICLSGIYISLAWQAFAPSISYLSIECRNDYRTCIEQHCADRDQGASHDFSH